MKLPFHYGLKDANEVLRRVRVALTTLKVDKHTDFHVESFTNCREQGYTILGSIYNQGPLNREFYCSFAQHRSSDSVVVNLGTKLMHDRTSLYQPFCGNIAEDVVWRQNRTFSPYNNDHYQEAANFIANEIALFLSEGFTNSKQYIQPEKVRKTA